MAKTSPPKESAFPAAAPVATGAEVEEVALPASVLDDASEASGVAVEVIAPVPVAMVELPPTMGVTRLVTGTIGVAVATTELTMTDVAVRVAVEVTSTLEAEAVTATEETSEAAGTAALVATLVAGGAWI